MSQTVADGELMEVLAPDVVLVVDGGGKVPAARKPINGADRVVGFFLRAAKAPEFAAAAVWLNGMPGIRFDVRGMTAAVSLEVRDRRITRIFAIANPHKLRQLDATAELQR